MASEVLLPKQGNSVESCIIVQWKVAEGESVKAGDSIVEVETDKATMDVESSADGVLLKQLVGEGDDVPVLSPIAIVGEAGEQIDDLVPGAEAPAASPAPPAAAPETPAPKPGTPAAQPAAPAAAAQPPASAAAAGTPRTRERRSALRRSRRRRRRIVSYAQGPTKKTG